MMAVVETTISTERASRYLAQLCQHLNHLAQVPAGHGTADSPKITEPVRRNGDAATVGFDAGLLRMQATATHLTLRIETSDPAAMGNLQALVTHRVATIGRRDNLKVTWRQVV